MLEKCIRKWISIGSLVWHPHVGSFHMHQGLGHRHRTSHTPMGLSIPRVSYGSGRSGHESKRDNAASLTLKTADVLCCNPHQRRRTVLLINDLVNVGPDI